MHPRDAVGGQIGKREPGHASADPHQERLLEVRQRDGRVRRDVGERPVGNLHPESDASRPTREHGLCERDGERIPEGIQPAQR